MKVRDIMTANPGIAAKGASLQHVAEMMVECDCGAIPIVESEGSKKPVGIITDRDITVRTLGKGKNPMQMQAGDVMTASTITVTPDSDADEAVRLMENNQVRRLVVVDHDGKITGMLAQADIALATSDETAGEVVEEISEPGSGSS